MGVEEKVETDLGILKRNIKTVSKNEVVCLVHSRWLNELLSQGHVPQGISKFEQPTNDVYQQFSNEVENLTDAQWKKIFIYGIPNKKIKINKLPKVSHKISSSSTDLNYFQLIHYVTETNYKNLWKQAWHKYCAGENRSNNRPVELQNFSDVVYTIVKRLFNCPVIRILQNHSSKCDITSSEVSTCSDLPHPNLVQAVCIVESESFFYLMYEKPLYTLHHCTMFSPAVLGTSTIRQLFVAYQLLTVLRSIHNNGLYMGAVTLKDIYMDQNLWIRLFPQIFSELELSVSPSKSVDILPLVKNDDKSAKISAASTLQALTEGWVRGAVSNYDYLLQLNKLACRIKDNPHCHPVLPWVTNFTVPEGGWRDLTKSKFRLNKGDKQLDLIYESASIPGNTTAHGNVTNIQQSSAIMVPHHTSDVLTDITYYVYKARRMPKSVLCEHVRTKWVPAEYPSSIERLQEWTPDECIPEFFSDPTIFYSIHPDLPDLAVPSWCEGPEEFIKKHRAALESEHVSERLHHWIDLTFGYRLSGSAAMKSKNVCLPLVDLHTTIRSHGMVQLFNHPHPHRMSNSLYFSSLAPKTFKNAVSKIHETKDSGEDETSSESSGKAARWKVLRSKSMPAGPEQLRAETRPENLTIILPKDYMPLNALKQLESFYMFLAKTQGGGKASALKQTIDFSSLGELQNQSKDMLVLGCIISEMCLSSHSRLLPQSMSLQERYVAVCKLLKSYKHQVPRCFSQVIRLLLQLTPSFEPESANVKDGQLQLPARYPPVSSCGLPPPSPHQLLQPLIRTIPFPTYFPELYSFLEQLNAYSNRLQQALKHTTDNPPNQDAVNDMAKSKVCFAAEKLMFLLPRLNSEAIELLTPYLQEMFENPHTALFAAWHLFNIVSQCLGPQQTARKLLKALIKVFDPNTPSSKYMKLYHRTFLLQLIIRLGLLNFLAHFMTILIEAVGGLKDFLPEDLEFYQKCGSLNSSVRRKSSHLQSPELQHMAEVSERDLNSSVAEKAPSYDEDISQGDGPYGDVDDEKDQEIFDFDEASEDSVKIMRGPDASVSHDEKYGTSNFDQCHSDGENQAIAGDESKEDEEDPDDTLASPTAESEKSTKYSQSAPNPTSHILQYKHRHSPGGNSEPPGKQGVSELPDETGAVALSPSNSKLDNSLNISNIAVESILWLAHRLGPVLTARYLTRNLLRMLTLCYDGPEKKIIVAEIPQCSAEKSSISISRVWYSGDSNAVKVLDCLSRIAALYGQQFIMLQYLPHIAELLTLCKKRVSDTLESGLIGAMSLLQHIIPYLSDATLMDHLQDVIIKDVLNPVIRLISSLRINYPSGAEARLIITCRLMDIIYIIGLRIGFEMTRKHLSSLLQRFFSCFDKVYEPDGEYKSLQDSAAGNTSSPLKERALEEMRGAFTPEIAYLSYIPFCKLAGGIFMEQTLKNDELIRHLCLVHDRDMAQVAPAMHCDEDTCSISSTASIKSHCRNPSLGQEESFVSGVFGKNVNVVGNRLDVQLGEESHLVAPVGDPMPQSSTSSTSSAMDVPKYDINLLRKKMDNTQRHLKGNWLAYWEHEKGRSEKDDHFNFKQIKLQSFIGHSAAVRTIQVLDNENSFITSSKDKTVKLWSLRSWGDGSAVTPCQWTYTQHRKSVFAVSFLDSLRLVGSCDSTVHIWDPFLGSCIKQIEPTKGSPITVLASMPAPSTTFLAATTNSTVRFLDARTCRYMHEFKVSIGSTGLIRCLAVSPNGYWLAIGHSTGMISVLDVRTGMLFGAWMGHEGEVLQLKAFNNSYFVTSSLDHCMTVWNSEDSQPKCQLKGPVEPVTSLCFYKGEVISGTAGNKIGLHTSIDRRASYSSTRLRSDAFKGMLTTMALLPLNRLLLLGADSGSVVLLS